MKKKEFRKTIAAGAVLLLLAGCAGTAGTAGTGGTKAPEDPGEVNVYTAVDQVHSEQIFKDFEEKTGIKVNPVYDLEANKTTGLTNKILTEMDHPVCDVFWNNEFAQTIALQRQGALAPYVSPAASDIPDAYKDKDGYWTAFGGRARTLLVNTDLLAKPATRFQYIDDYKTVMPPS